MKRCKGMIVMLLLVPMAGYSSWMDFFDSEPADSGPPDQYGVFGSPLDSGVTTTLSLSGPNSAFVVTDLDGVAFGFESIMVHDVVSAMDLTGATLSVALASDVDLSASPGHVAFHLYDADGSEWRTANADLFAPGLTFSPFTQSVNDLTEQVNVGTVPGLDVTNIVRYGLDFYDQPGSGDQATVFYVDNFTATTTAVPEPGTASLLLISVGSLLGLSRRWAVRRRNRAVVGSAA